MMPHHLGILYLYSQNLTKVQKIKPMIHRLFHLLNSAFLYLWNLATVRKIQLESLVVESEQLCDQWRTVILWKVRGCHRIKVKGYFNSLPGNAKGISLKDSKNRRFITITFKGAFRNIVRNVPVQVGYLDLTRQFAAASPDFIVTGNKFSRQNVSVDFSLKQLKAYGSEILVYADINPTPSEYLQSCSINQNDSQ